VPKAGARSFVNNGWLRPVAEGERSEGRGGGLRGTSTRSHGAQAGRSATKEPDFARRAMDSRRHTRRHRAEAGGRWLLRLGMAGRGPTLTNNDKAKP
jgi:hypothetical protein